MKLRQLLRGAAPLGASADLEMEIYRISYDTRTLRPGDLFVALEGEKEDGHRHMAEAFTLGAAAALCRVPPEEGPWVRVADTRAALAAVSAEWFGHPADGLKVIGVTGTNGKTTTTYLIKTMLEEVLGAKVGLIGTNQILIGDRVLPTRRTTPESWELQRLFRQMTCAGCTHVVMEVSSHALALHRTDGIPFRVGVFTNLTQDHLDFHHTMTAYREAKGKLFAQCAAAVLNLDDEAGRWYAEHVDCPVLTYSEGKDTAWLTARNVTLLARAVRFEAVTRGRIARVEVPIPGGFTLYNALAALGAGLVLGLPLERMAAALSRAKGVKGRLEVVDVPAEFTVLIDYAHTPDALENVLTTLRSFTKGRLICLFGCGGDRDKTKRAPMGGLAAALSDVVVLTSDNPRSEDPNAILRDILAGMTGSDTPRLVVPDRREAIRTALALARPGDVVLLAGKGHETYQEIRGQFLPFDEREEVAAFFAEEDAAVPAMAKRGEDPGRSKDIS